MNIKKEVTSLVLSLCLLGNIMMTPVASAASPAELLDKYFPSISALREGSAGKNSILEDLELLDQWRSLVDQGMEKLVLEHTRANIDHVREYLDIELRIASIVRLNTLLELTKGGAAALCKEI